MVSADTFRKLSLSFPEATETPHFEKHSFRVRNKIFATYDPKTNHACLKLSEIYQDVFSKAAKSVIYPLENKWGKQGWTIIELNDVKKSMLMDALRAAYSGIAPKKLVALIQENDDV